LQAELRCLELEKALASLAAPLAVPAPPEDTPEEGRRALFADLAGKLEAAVAALQKELASKGEESGMREVANRTLKKELAGLQKEVRKGWETDKKML
jgi:hypothetical protein